MTEDNNESKGPLRGKSNVHKGDLLITNIEPKKSTRMPTGLPENQGQGSVYNEQTYYYQNQRNDIPINDFASYFGGSPSNNRNWRRVR